VVLLWDIHRALRQDQHDLLERYLRNENVVIKQDANWEPEASVQSTFPSPSLSNICRNILHLSGKPSKSPKVKTPLASWRDDP
jgi:hypothetical protein